MKRRAIAFGAGLLAGTWFPAVAAPPSDTWFSSCEGPIATCGRPHPSSVIEEIWPAKVNPHEQPPHSIPQSLRLPEVLQQQSLDCPESNIAAPAADVPEGPQPIPEAGIREARAVLWQWQAATQSRLPASEAERIRLAYERPDLTGQERAIAHQFRGPIDAGALWERYEWSVSRWNGFRMLTAIPRDTLDRLLCGRIEVRLDESWHLATIAFADTAGANRAIIAREEKRHVAAKIITAEYTSETSAPTRLRTAALGETVELTPAITEKAPRLLRIRETLSLPPAPVEIAPEAVD